jgi:solute carrier family 6 amino acid transporter-like protein 5/7/9/14
MSRCNWLINFNFRNALTISIANILTSIFAGFVIFAYMGYLSYMTGQDVENVVSEGKYL